MRASRKLLGCHRLDDGWETLRTCIPLSAQTVELVASSGLTSGLALQLWVDESGLELNLKGLLQIVGKWVGWCR